MLTRPENDLEAIVAVAHLYRMILRRPVDRDGLLNHAARLMAGESLHAFASILLTSAEGRAVWKQRGARSVAASIWRQAGFGGRPDGGLRFARLWRHSGRDPSVLAAALVLTDRVRAVPLLPTLFPDGIDLSADDVFCGWEYRLWAEETDRLSTGGLPAGAGRRQMLDLVLCLRPEDGAHAIRTTLASLLAQRHRLWRLSLVGRLPDGVRLPDDPRFRFVEAARRLDGAAWLGWLSAGDTLSPCALSLFARAIHRHPAALLVYCDEDRLEPDGLRSMPVFKTGWDALAAASAEIVGGLAVYRASLVPERLRLVGEDAAHDRQDQVTRHGPLQMPASTAAIHLPAVLFHRRLARPPLPIVRPLCGAPAARVSIVIATRDQPLLVARCVRSIMTDTDYPGVEIVLVDNGSTSPEALAVLVRLEAEGCTVLRRPGPFNWSSLNNAGIAATHGGVVVLMNDDVAALEPTWLATMASAALRPEVGVAGALLRFPDGAVQHAGIVLGPAPVAAHAWTGSLANTAALQSFSAVTGACMAFRRTVFDALGGLDEGLPVTWNDIDFCLRAREHGLDVVLCRDAVLQHDESATRGPDGASDNIAMVLAARAHMGRRHRLALAADPFVNPQTLVASGGRLLHPAAARRVRPILRTGGRA